jgi:hypothetical protein
LRGQVSPIHIRKCLAGKYKKGYQYKITKQKERLNKNNLAPLLLLKPKEKETEDEQKNKQVLTLDVDSQKYVQRENDNGPTIASPKS